MHWSHSLCEGRTSFCTRLENFDLQKTLQILFFFVFDQLFFNQCLSSFLSIDHFLCLSAQFLILFHQTQMRFSRSTHLQTCCSLETLTTIIRTGLFILVELTHLVNSVIIFLSQMTLFRWFTFLLGSQTVILSPAFLDLFLSSNASIFSTMAFPPLENSDYVVVSVSTDFPPYS